MSWYQPPLEGGLQDPPSDDIINPSEREEVVIVPLYGVVHDSPLITAAQKGVRRMKRNEAKTQGDVESLVRLFTPLLLKIEAQMLKAEEEKAKKKNK
jgi:hypothetical protein